MVDWFSAGSGFGSALGGLFSSNSSAKKQFKYQSALQAQAAKLNYEYGLKSLENSPTATRTGLQNAGYNPMLAVQNATGGANAGWTTTGQAQNVDYSQSMSNALDFKRVQNETKTAESTQDLNYASADKAKAEKASLLERLPFISKRERAEIANIDKDSLMKESQIHNIDETTRFIEKRYELDKLLGLMGISTQRYGYDKNFEYNIYNARTNEYNSKYSTPFRAFVNSIKNEGKKNVDYYMRNVKKDKRGVINPWVY